MNSIPPTGTTFKIACPGCGQHFEAAPEHIGTTADCTTCGQSFTVQAPVTMCKQHGNVPAQCTCDACGAALCSTCTFPRPGGGHWCPDCAAAQAARRSPPIPASAPFLPPSAPAYGSTGLAYSAPMAGVMCAVHREVPAVQRCSICKTPVCATCDFAFPGGIHTCPTCASKPQTGLGERRKNPVIISYVLAGASTLCMGFVFTGGLPLIAHSPSDLRMLAGVVMMIVFAMAIAGTIMAVSSLDKRLGNPGSIWGSVVWNSVILGILILLSIIGNLKR